MPRRRRTMSQARCERSTRPREQLARRTRKQGRFSGLFLPPGLSAQLRAGFRLARTTPGLSVYLLGGLGIWIGWRVLTSHQIGGFGGALLAATLRLLALGVVVAAYFRRTGQLAEARVNLRRLRAALTIRLPAREHRSRMHRRVFRLLSWALRVPVDGAWRNEG